MGQSGEGHPAGLDDPARDDLRPARGEAGRAGREGYGGEHPQQGCARRLFCCVLRAVLAGYRMSDDTAWTRLTIVYATGLIRGTIFSGINSFPLNTYAARPTIALAPPFSRGIATSTPASRNFCMNLSGGLRVSA
jgi:hypothetical protein